MLSAIQLIRLISIPLAIVMFIVAAQMSASLTLQTADGLIVVSNR